MLTILSYRFFSFQQVFVFRSQRNADWFFFATMILCEYSGLKSHLRDRSYVKGANEKKIGPSLFHVGEIMIKHLLGMFPASGPLFRHGGARSFQLFSHQNRRGGIPSGAAAFIVFWGIVVSATTFVVYSVHTLPIQNSDEPKKLWMIG